MQTWNDSLYLAKEKILTDHFQNDESLTVSVQAETGSGGDQPFRNNLTDWNGQWDPKSPLLHLDRSGSICLRKRFASVEVKNA